LWYSAYLYALNAPRGVLNLNLDNMTFKEELIAFEEDRYYDSYNDIICEDNLEEDVIYLLEDNENATIHDLAENIIRKADFYKIKDAKN
jgi:hypothetical protein